MKTILILLVTFLVGACSSTRPLPGPPPPVDEAEYYAPGRTGEEVVNSRKLLPDPINGLGQTSDPSIRLTDIRQTASYTVLYMTFALGDPRGRDFTYSSSSSEISIQPDAVLMPRDSRDTYKLVKATGIPTYPNSAQVKGNERVDFMLYFERLPDTVEHFAMFECKRTNTQTCWNITGMKLEKEKKL
ncbi:MAG: hypothetical protein LH609_19200 [Rudanella sp.]|nr:hypothetical protein [Rudanella sp.]